MSSDSGFLLMNTITTKERRKMARITKKEYDAVVAERDKINWKFNVLEEKVAGTQYKLDTARDKTRQLQRENNTLVGILTTLHNRGMLRMISDSMEDTIREVLQLPEIGNDSQEN